MTITQEDQRIYDSKVSTFTRQSEENTCLPVTIVNVIDELADAKNKPEMKVDFEDILDVVDYDPFLGSTTDFIPERLSPYLQPHQFTVQETRGLNLDDLEQIISNDSASYPIVEFDSRYQGWVDGYDVEAGMEGRAQPHTVIPFAFNSESVLIFDPYESFYTSTPTEPTPPHEIPQPLFIEWWSGESVPRWTMWIEQATQQTLGQTTNQVNLQ